MTWRELQAGRAPAPDLLEEEGPPRLPDLVPGSTLITTKPHVWAEAFRMYIGAADAEREPPPLKNVALEFGIKLSSLARRAADEEWTTFRRAASARRREARTRRFTPCEPVASWPRALIELSRLRNEHDDELARRALQDEDFIRRKLALTFAWRGKRPPAYLRLPRVTTAARRAA